MESYTPQTPFGIPPGYHGGHPSQNMAGTFRPQEPLHYAQHAPHANSYQYQPQTTAAYNDPRLSQNGPQYFPPPHSAPPLHVPPYPTHGTQQQRQQQPPAHHPHVAPAGYPTWQHPRMPSPAPQFDNRYPHEHARTTVPPIPPVSTYPLNSGLDVSENEPVARGLVPPPGGFIPITLAPGMTQSDAARIWFSLSPQGQRQIYDEWREEQGMHVDPASTSGRRRSAKSKKQVPNGSGGPQDGASSAPRGRFATRCEDASDDEEQPPRPNGSQGPSDSFAVGVYGNAKGKERAQSPNTTYSHPRPQYGSAHTQPPETRSDPHFGVLMMDGFSRLETRIDRIEDTFARFAGQQPATGTQSSAPGLRFLRKKAPVNGEGGGVALNDGQDAAEEDGSEDGDDLEDESEDESEEQKLADKPFKTLLAKYIRFHMDVKLMKLKSIDHLAAKFAPLTDAEIAAYEAHDGPFVNADNYRPDFVQGWKRSSYNREVRMFTVEDFLAALKGGSYQDPPLPDRFQTKKRIERAADGHMSYLRDKYREQTHEQTPEFLLKLQKTRMRKRCNTRKHTTLRVRRRTIDRHELPQLRTLYAKLAAEHMSGDEEVVAEHPNGTKTRKQAHPRKYHIVEAAWQSRKFAKCSRTLDQWNIQDWEQSVGGRLPGGSGPRERIELAKPRVVNSAAPRGLWRNCYSQKWLKKQKPHTRAKLKIIDEDFDFELPTYSTPPDLDNADFGLSDEDESEVDGDPDERMT